MKTMLIKFIANAGAIWVTTLAVHGVNITHASFGAKVKTICVVALIFGLINVFVKPVVKMFSLPLFILTLGLITFVINAVMLLLTSWIAGRMHLDFHVTGFFPALLGALCISIVAWFLHVVMDRD